MALRSNGNQFQSSGVRHYGSTAVLSAYPAVLHGQFAMTGNMRNLTAGEGITSEYVGVPMGYVDKGWMLPQKAGGVSSRAGVFGITASGSILGGKALETAPPEPSIGIDAEATGSLTATVPAAGATSDLGMSTNTPLLTASIAGSGGTTLGVSVDDALLGAIASLTADAEFTFSGALTSFAIGIMEGSTADTGLTVDNVVAGVWSAAAIDNNAPGTMGNKLNGAASAGDPWSTALPGTYADGEAGKIISDIKAKTDSLTFTQAGHVDANIKRVADTAVDGEGTADVPWGPA